MQRFNYNNTCVVSGSLSQLVPKLMISLLNHLYIEFRVIPSIVGQKISVSVELPQFYLGIQKRTAIKFVSFLNNNNDKDCSLSSHPGLDTNRQRQYGMLFYHGTEISILKIPTVKRILALFHRKMSYEYVNFTGQKRLCRCDQVKDLEMRAFSWIS